MSINALPNIEREALYLLLSDENITCQILRAQLNHVTNIIRTETGAGVYVNFEFGDDVQPLRDLRSLQLSDVFAISQKCEEIGFLLFVKAGLIDFLEAYVYGDAFPSYLDCSYTLNRGDEQKSKNGQVNLID